MVVSEKGKSRISLAKIVLGINNLVNNLKRLQYHAQDFDYLKNMSLPRPDTTGFGREK